MGVEGVKSKFVGTLLIWVTLNGSSPSDFCKFSLVVSLIRRGLCIFFNIDKFIIGKKMSMMKKMRLATLAANERMK